MAPLVETSRKVRTLVLVMTTMWVEEQRAIPTWMSRERMSLTTEKVKLKIRLSRSRPWRHIGSWKVIAPLILTLGTTWRWVVNFKPRPLHSREEAGTIWIRGWMGRTAGLDCYAEEEIFFPHQDLNPVPFDPYLAAIPTTLSRLKTRQISRELCSSNDLTVYKVRVYKVRAITRTQS